MSFSCVLSSYSEIHFNLAEKTTPVGFNIISGLPLLKKDIDTSWVFAVWNMITLLTRDLDQ